MIRSLPQTLFALLCFPLLVFASPVDTVYVSSWDHEVQDWRYETRYVFSSMGQQETVLSQRWSSEFAGWIPWVKNIQTHDVSGNPITNLTQNWEHGRYENALQTLIDYNEGKRSKILHQVWSDSNWLDQHQEIFTYDEQGNLLVRVVQEAGKKGGWINQDLYRYFYREDGLCWQCQRQGWDQQFGSWTDFDVQVFLYDETDRILHQSLANMHPTEAPQKFLQLKRFEYDGQGRLSRQWFMGRQEGNLPADGAEQLREFRYNAQDSLVEQVDYAVDKLPAKRLTQRFDRNNRRIERISYVYELAEGNWKARHRWQYRYQNAPDEAYAPKRLSKSLLVKTPAKERVRLRLLDLSGRELRQAEQLEGEELLLSTEGLPGGLYIFLLESIETGARLNSGKIYIE